MEFSPDPVKTHPRHHRVLIGGEPAMTWTASKQLPRPIRVLSASRKTQIAFPLRTDTLGTQGLSRHPRQDLNLQPTD